MNINFDKEIETTTGKPAKVVSRDYRRDDGEVCLLIQVETSPTRSQVHTYNPKTGEGYLALRNKVEVSHGYHAIYQSGISRGYTHQLSVQQDNPGIETFLKITYHDRVAVDAEILKRIRI